MQATDNGLPLPPERPKSVADFRAVIEAQLTRLCARFSADAATFHLYDSVQDRLIFPVGVGLQKKSLFEWLPGERGPAANILRSGQDVFTEDAKRDPLFRGRFAHDEEVIASAAFPLAKSSGVKFGIIFLNYRTAHQFTTEERQALQTAVSVVSLQVQEQLTEKLWRDIVPQAGLHRELDALQKIAVTVSNLLEDTEAVIWLVEPDGNLVAAAHSGFEGYSGQVFGTRQRAATPSFIVQALQLQELQSAKIGSPMWPSDGLHQEGVECRRWKSAWAFPVARFGVLTVYTVGHSTLSRHQQAIGGAFAEQVRATIEAHNHIKALQALNDVGSKLNLTFGKSEDLLASIVEMAARVLQADWITLHQYDPLRQEFLTLEHSVTFPLEAREALEPPRQEGGVSARVRDEGRIVISDTKDASEAIIDTRHISKFDIRAFIGIRLVANNETLGVLFFNYRYPREFSRDDMTVVSLFAEYATSAIRNSRLLRNLEERERDLAALNKVGQALTSTIHLSEGEILEQIRIQASQLVPMDNMYIALYDASTDMVRFGLAYQQGKPIPQEWFLPGSGSPWQPRSGGRGRTEEIIRTKRSMFLKTKTEAQTWHDQPGRTEYLGQISCSWIGVPMVRGDQVLGVIAAHDPNHDNAYESKDLEILETLASQAAIVLHNAELFNDLQKRASELLAIQDITAAIGAESSIEILLRKVAQVARDVVHADTATVYQYDPDFQEFYLQVKLGPEDHPLPRKGGASEGILQSGRIIFADDAQSAPGIGTSSFTVERRVLSCMAAPLKVGDVPIGILYVNFFSAPHRFTEDERRILKIIADQAAIGIQTAGRLYDANRRLKTVLESIAVARDCETLDELLHIFLDRALDAIGAENGTIQLLDKAADRLVVRAHRGRPVNREFQNISAHQAITGRALKEDGPVYIEDASADSTYLGFFDDTRSELAVLLATPQETIGVLSAESPRPRAFDVSARRLLHLFAEQAAVLISERKKLDEAERRRLDDRSSEMTRNMAHHIKNNLGSARYRLNNFVQNADLSAEQSAELERVDANMKRCIGITQDLFRPYRSDERRNISPRLLVRNALDLFGQPPGTTVTVQVPDSLPDAWVEIHNATDYIHELLINAAAANEWALKKGLIAEGVIEISAHLDELHRVVLRIINNGPAIPNSDWERIFEQFTGFTRDAERAEHYGLGLWGARTFFRRQGGDVFVAESDQEHTAFAIRLPSAR